MPVLFEAEEFREEFNSICEKLVTRDSAKKCLAVAGVSGGEGATTVAVNLGYAFAEQQGIRTLLVDGNPRRPGIHKALNIACEGGLSDWDGESDLTYKPCDCSKNLWALTAGSQPANRPWERWGTILPVLLEQARTQFGMVVFDSPPVGRYPDSMVLARTAGGVVLVAESDQTSLEMLNYAREQIGSAGAELVGLILNRRGRYIPRWLRS